MDLRMRGRASGRARYTAEPCLPHDNSHASQHKASYLITWERLDDVAPTNKYRACGKATTLTRKTRIQLYRLGVQEFR